jgi:hypothetical protein
MPGFYGRSTVLRDLRKHQRTGKVRGGTLRVRENADTTTSTVWANYYLAPVAEDTGVGQNGAPAKSATLYLWRVGEAAEPRPDDVFREAGVTSDTAVGAWTVRAVTRRLDADVADGFAVYDCQVTQAG